MGVAIGTGTVGNGLVGKHPPELLRRVTGKAERCAKGLAQQLLVG
jgi:hypothetical protein